MTDDPPQELSDNPFGYDPNEPARCWECGALVGLCVCCLERDVDDYFDMKLYKGLQ